ncbi:hypothetical protein [Humisphaera borealis]|uniref:DUF3299 domain-containing protein n=1 Tax=Humisphaera borealis TaxID=2807512 RepID=A0A7M2WST6_9BACT|nr:hypothetical protein [Humisphaera borealis]QOV88242.1 hypothetical protein IPV69_18565 [Humisphaera borealis]
MTTVPYSPQTSPAPAAGSRVNVRLIAFLLVISAPFVYIIGKSVMFSMSGGITDRGDYKEVDLKALGNFPFDQSEGKLTDIPERYRNLDGQRVRLTGFMYAPENAGDRGNRFQFVYDVNKCCFGSAPQVQERVFAYAKHGAPIYPYTVLAEVVGKLHVRIVKEPDGLIKSVFDLDVEQAQEVR